MTEAGAMIWRGPSELNGADIVALAIGLGRGSRNEKTGAMIQTYVLRTDIHPLNAAIEGMDIATCGDCKLRPVFAHERKAATGKSGAQCYVNLGRGPSSVYRAFLRGDYPEVAPAVVGALAKLKHRRIRIGAYGDPAAVPLRVWTELMTGQSSRTGYTHAWRGRPDLMGIVMASVDTIAERDEARALGWRTFRVRGTEEPIESGEIDCPASAESGHRTTCAKCGLCDGARINDVRKSITIIDHGPTVYRSKLSTQKEV